jgi:hypothetical protein
MNLEGAEIWEASESNEKWQLTVRGEVAVDSEGRNGKAV